MASVELIKTKRKSRFTRKYSLFENQLHADSCAADLGPVYMIPARRDGAVAEIPPVV